MNAFSNIEQHPQFVSIPDPQLTVGIRAYREPEKPHPLQLAFLDPAFERAWVEELRSLLASGQVEEAAARLDGELAGFDGSLAKVSRATAAANVALEGWDELLPTLAEWEGSPITAITVGMTNPPDLVFQDASIPEPDLLVGLFSDDAFPFSGTKNLDLLAVSGEGSPPWVGAEEDVEFYCTLSGLAELNAALINCKHRYFLRDGRDGVEGRAPGGYVEYVLGCWLLATRFLQALTQAISEHGSPKACRIIAGTVDVHADFITVIGPEMTSALATPSSAKPEPSFASLTAKPLPARKEPISDSSDGLPTIRQRLRSLEPEPAPKQKRGFLARLLGRLRRG